MKKAIAIVAACMLSVAAHADVLVKKGTRTMLHVEYAFDSSGDAWSSSKDQHNKWDIKRTVIVEAQFVADEPRAFGVMHDKDAAQLQNIENLKGKTQGAMAKAAPTMNDMMKIVSECGGADSKASQECIEKKVSNYGNNMSDAQVGQLKSAGADVAGIQQATTGSRFQLWKMVSMSGSYQVGENVSHQVFEMTCTNSKVCRRDTTIKGGGGIGMPPGVKTIAGAAMFEVDSLKGDVKMQLPVPLTALQTKQEIVTTIPGETASTTTTVLKPFYLEAAAKPMTASALPSISAVTGRKEIMVPGQYHEGGKITVSWRFTAPQ